MIFSATNYFLFQNICITISMLNNFLFKYAVLENQNN